MSAEKLLLISTGGTIAMQPDTLSSGGIVPVLNSDDLLNSVPDINNHYHIINISYTNKPGASLNWHDMLSITNLLNEQLNMPEIKGAVVIQGTDTIEETAFVFDVLVNSEKPVVVTGAMRSATMVSADGPANLSDALLTAASPAMCGQGTLVVLNGEIHAARNVIKNHTSQLNAFVSRQPGIIASIVENNILTYYTAKRTSPLPFNIKNNIPDVMLIKACLADNATLFRLAAESGCKGIILEGMGAGHVPDSYASLISEFSREIPIVLTSRVLYGSTFKNTYGFIGSEIDSLQRGAIYSGGLGSLRSRILLSLLLANHYPLFAIKEEFKKRL